MCHVEALNAKCLSSPKKAKIKIPPKNIGKGPSPVKPTLLKTSPQKKCDRRKAAKRKSDRNLLEETHPLSDDKCNNSQDFLPEIVETGESRVCAKKSSVTRQRKRKCNTVLDV